MKVDVRLENEDSRRVFAFLTAEDEEDAQKIKSIFKTLGDLRCDNGMTTATDCDKKSVELRFEVKPQRHFILDRDGNFVDADKLLKEYNLSWTRPEEIFYKTENTNNE